MSLYEVMYIIQPDLESEELLDGAIEKVNSTIEKAGGEIVSQKKVGKRRLAYEIDDYKDGIYVLINVQTEQSIVPVLEHFFKVNEGYLRYMILRLEEEKAAVQPNDEEEMEPETEEIIAEPEAEIEEEEKTE